MNLINSVAHYTSINLLFYQPLELIEKVEMPSNLIEEICLVLRANENSNKSLTTLYELLKEYNDEVHFKISKSKILIQ